jgi:hypothetical protein
MIASATWTIVMLTILAPHNLNHIGGGFILFAFFTCAVHSVASIFSVLANLVM